jgi:hypothetical protein
MLMQTPKATLSSELPEADRKREPIIKWPALFAGTAAAVTATFLSSYLGIAGTLFGAAAASAISGTSSALYEHFIRRSHEKLRQVPKRPWIVAVTASACILGLTLVTITIVEIAARKPVAAFLPGSNVSNQRGTSVGDVFSGTGGGDSTPSQPPTPAPQSPEQRTQLSQLPQTPSQTPLSPGPEPTLTQTPASPMPAESPEAPAGTPSPLPTSSP